MRKAAVVTKRNSKRAGKGGKTAVKAGVAKKAVARKPARAAKVAKPLARVAAKSTRSKAKKAKTPPRPAAKAKPTVKKQVATSAPKKAAARPASVKTAARALAAARASASKRRPPSYIPRSRFSDDWMPGGGGPVELPRQPTPAAHTPTRKPPKPRAPKPKAISHEQAVANLKALLESRKRKDRGGDAGAAAAKGA